MDSLMTLIDRWHAHERDGDPEAGEARHTLEMRIAELGGYASGVGDAISPEVSAVFAHLIDGKA